MSLGNHLKNLSSHRLVPLLLRIMVGFGEVLMAALVVIVGVGCMMLGVKIGRFLERGEARRVRETADVDQPDLLRVWYFPTGTVLHRVSDCPVAGSVPSVALSRRMLPKKLILVRWCDKCAPNGYQ